MYQPLNLPTCVWYEVPFIRRKEKLRVGACSTSICALGSRLISDSPAPHLQVETLSHRKSKKCDQSHVGNLWQSRDLNSYWLSSYWCPNYWPSLYFPQLITCKVFVFAVLKLLFDVFLSGQEKGSQLNGRVSCVKSYCIANC